MGKLDPADRAERYVDWLDTGVGMAGEVAAERLVVQTGRIFVLFGEDFEERRGEWQFDQIAGFRIEPTVGSCFLQAQIDGQWVDVLRRAGAADAAIADLVRRLNDRCRLGHWPGANQRPTDGESGPDRPPRHGADRRQSDRWQTIRRLARIVGPFRGSVALLLVLSAGAVAIELAPPMLQKALIDDVLDPKQVVTPAGRLGLLLLGSSLPCWRSVWRPQRSASSRGTFPAALARR